MRIEFLGTGTSQGVPEIQCTCPVCISADPRDKRLRSSLWVEHEGFNLIVDTGPDFRQQCLRSNIPRIDAALITHLHADHIMGLDDIRRYNRLQKQDLPVFLPRHMEQEFRSIFGYTLQEPQPGLFRPSLKLQLVDTQPLKFPGFSIQPIPVIHSGEEILGYRFDINDQRIAYLTDCREVRSDAISMVSECDILILGALWKEDWRHTGHMNLAEAIEFANMLSPGKTYFTHITHWMGLHSVTNSELPDGIQLAYDGVCLEI